MNQSLAVTITLEGGLPSIFLCAQDHYHSPSQTFKAPMEFVDIDILIQSLQQAGEYWFVTASPDAPQFQLESPIIVQHQGDVITWDLVYEHYEPFLDLSFFTEDEYEEGMMITLSFDRFQYASALQQGFQLAQHIEPVTFNYQPDTNSDDIAPPHQRMLKALPATRTQWLKYGNANAMIQNGHLVNDHDQFAHEAEVAWLQDILESLETAHGDDMRDNLDAYLESLPSAILNRLEKDGTKLSDMLDQRWAMLVNSLTEEEAESLENDDSAQKFPNSLKLRLMREFLNGNPSVLLGYNPHFTDSESSQSKENIVHLEHWRKAKQTEPDD